MCLAPTPHLDKNEHVDHRLQPVAIPAWRVSGLPHHLCPVWCTAAHIALLLKILIDAADPGNLPRAQEVRRLAATLAFSCPHTLDAIQQSGQWSSPNSFADRYLVVLHLRDTLFGDVCSSCLCI